MASNVPHSGVGGSRLEDLDTGNEPPRYEQGNFGDHPSSHDYRPNAPERQRLHKSPERGISRADSGGYSRGGDPRYDDHRAGASRYDRPPKGHGDYADDPARDRESSGSRAATLLKGARGFISKASDNIRYGPDPRDDRQRSHDRPDGYGGGRHPMPYDAGPKPQPKGPSRSELTRALEEANQVNRGLKDQVKALDDACQQLKRRNDAMQSARDSQEGLLGRQEPDSAISAQFHDIFGQVKAWSNKFCREARPVDVSHVPEDQAVLVSRVVPSLQSLDDLSRVLPPGDIKRRRKFIRGWIALNVAEAMFRSLPAPRHTISAGSDIWIASGPRDAIKTLELLLLQSGEAITRSAFHEWRSLTFALFDKMYPAPRWPAETFPSIVETAQSTVSLIKSLLSPSANLTELEDRLVENVFIPAVKLSQVLRRQRACWYVRFPHIMTANTLPQNDYVKPYVFNSDFMKDTDSYDDEEDDVANHCLKAVEIIITPSLFKSGNHDGEQYDIEFPVEKAEVSCSDIQTSETKVPS